MAAEEAVAAPRATTWSAPPALVAVAVIAVAAMSFAKFEDIGQALVGAIFSGVLVVIAAVDLERRIIPNRIVLPAGVVVLAGNALVGASSAWEYVISAGVALAVASVISLASRGGLGMGDAKLCFLLGAGLGWNITGALLLAGGVLGLGYYHERLSRLSNQAGLSGKPGELRDVAPPTASEAPAAAAPKDPGFPKPSNYGVYALNGDTLSELSIVLERAPDKRIAMSTPINEPSRTNIADGKVRFVLFRRDLVGNAPERIDVRVVARVVRALKFDSKGKPNFTPVSDSWNIRNVSHELRVRPISDNPEMLLVQSEKPDFELSPGRYVLVLKEQPYDFTVEGKITDAAQCLERTDAMNGSFYSECQKKP